MGGAERYALMRRVEDATVRFAATLGAMTDAQVREPSLLPGWTRGHVITHVARSGDALRELMAGARTGVPAYGYTSAETRDAAITAGAPRPAAEQLADVKDSAEAFAAEVAAMTDATAGVPVRVMTYAEFPAEQCVLRRLVELELHHVDLGLAYTPSDWPRDFAEMPLGEPMNDQRATRL